MKSIFNTFTIFASLLFFISSCSESTPTSSEMQLNDNQIINIMMTVDNNEIAAGQLATKKSSNSLVEKYAQNLIEMHQHNLKELTSVAQQLKLQPQESEISNSMVTEGKEELKKLDELQGNAFDQAYINAMVQGHQAGLKLIDTKLLPEAQSAKLKIDVEQFRKMVAQHLEKGLQIQKKLSK